MKIGVLGAGAVGCFVGGKLLAQGADVVFVGRERTRDEVAAYGLTLESLGEAPTVLTSQVVRYALDVGALAPCDVVLCAVKSEATGTAAASLAKVLQPGTWVVSLQNGLHNADLLRAALPAQKVLGGIVGFNVVARGEGVFRRATSGPLVIQWVDDARSETFLRCLALAGFQVDACRNLPEKQRTKLVINSSNALSALTGVPTRQLLFDPAYRRIVRAVMVEALAILRAAELRTARMGPLPIGFFPFMLGLPTWLFRALARAQLQVDPEARSSMCQDLDRRRNTEVELLNGELVRLAASCGAAAPLNQRLCALVHDAERAGQGSPQLSAQDLGRALGLR